MQEFSAYLNTSTGKIVVVKTPEDMEYKNNPNFTAICQEKTKKETTSAIEQYFEENLISEDQKFIL